MPRVLITGISGFVGKETAKEILKNPENQVVGLIRPNTNRERVSEFLDNVEFLEIDLCDVNNLKKSIENYSFDIVVHIGALRGGRPDSKDKYYLANVEATQIIANYCLNHKARLIYCSSVGVFGAIPKELPAKESTPRQDDNYYHFTKNRSEAIIQDLNLQGLDSVIIRPAITYGVGDYGFPYSLCKLVDKKMMLLSSDEVKIHLTNVHSLAVSFAYFVNNNVGRGKNYIIADKEPIKLSDLVQYISQKIHKSPYPQNRQIPAIFFALGRKIAKLLNNELFVSRFELISQSWYYNVDDAYEDIPLEELESIQNFDEVIDWYLGSK
ncbi:NAD(P)-dependent oxidoreductase [bacterium]|nr:NAD(P)-dependent oxidoreductase [bacterium]